MTDHEQVVEVDTRIDAPPDVVFEYFTDAEKHVRWMGVGMEHDPRSDGEYTLSMPDGHRAIGQYLLVDAPHGLTFTWGWEGSPDVPPGSTTVEVTLVPDGDGTIVRLRHSGLPNDEQREMHGQGWRRYLRRLTVAGGGGNPGPDDGSS